MEPQGVTMATCAVGGGNVVVAAGAGTPARLRIAPRNKCRPACSTCPNFTTITNFITRSTIVNYSIEMKEGVYYNKIVSLFKQAGFTTRNINKPSKVDVAANKI